jgi:hypothetical protein
MVNIEIKTGGMLIPVFELPEEDKKIYEEAVFTPSPTKGEGLE